jgi:hypothetical protein
MGVALGVPSTRCLVATPLTMNCRLLRDPSCFDGAPPCPCGLEVSSARAGPLSPDQVKCLDRDALRKSRRHPRFGGWPELVAEGHPLVSPRQSGSNGPRARRDSSGPDRVVANLTKNCGRVLVSRPFLCSHAFTYPSTSASLRSESSIELSAQRRQKDGTRTASSMISGQSPANWPKDGEPTCRRGGRYTLSV